MTMYENPLIVRDFNSEITEPAMEDFFKRILFFKCI